MTIKDTAARAAELARDKASAAKAAVGDAYGSVKNRSGDTYAATRDRASVARQRTADGIDEAPLATLIGGLAIGALAAAFLPRSRREDELLGGIGGKINDRAKEAARAAKEAGRDKLDELGINKESIKSTVKDVAGSVAGAAKSVGTAAAGAAGSSVKASGTTSVGSSGTGTVGSYDADPLGGTSDRFDTV